ncbi:hypothetical protein B0A50_06840 [Salinomyces thailandicus]|uniref:Ribonucleases P/MRP subunit Pop8-like domain-containing protein n=1 Tax=Salinomyces thailandicus TaxID=706561 RepID=A0A4U0TPX3_9PEZI|nr:hypothetical protein B0A50_06840 [Salinomyces thailandica]
MTEDVQLTDVTESTAVTLPTTQNDSVSERKRRKRKAKNHVLNQFTIRSPPWAYVHLQHLSPPGGGTNLDAVTAHLHLSAALSQFLGLHGTAIPTDIMKLEGREVWIRIPAEDKTALIAAVGGWVSGKGEGWRVKGASSWDARAMARKSGQELFHD